MNVLLSFSPSIGSLLRSFVAWRRITLLLRGVGMAFAIGLAWVLLICLMDRFVHLPTAGRWAAFIVGICLAGGNFIGDALRAMRPVNWIEVAGQIESRTDRFEQQLMTVVSQRLDLPERRGSKAMLEQTQRAVESLAANSHPVTFISWRSAFMPWIASGGVMAIFAGLWFLPALDLPRLMARLMHPSRRIDPVTLTRLEVFPGDTEVSAGGSVAITAAVSGSQMPSIQSRGVDVYLSTDGLAWSRAAMSAVSVTNTLDKFVFPLPGIDRDLRYYLRAGDARSEEFQIKVTRIPTAVGFHMRYTYPPYTRHAPVSVNNSDGLIEALQGCIATVTVTSNEPLASAFLTVDDFRREMIRVGKSTEWQIEVPLWDSANCSLEMISRAGVVGRGPSPMFLRALPDREPVVLIQQPASDLRLSPTDAITLHYSASDDYGLKSLDAIVRMNDSTAAVFPISLPENANRREGEFTFVLADLQAKVGDVISLSLRAEDYAGHLKTGEPQAVLISPVSVGIKAYARAAEFKRAARLATAWTDSLGKSREAFDAARAADPRSRGQEAWVRANHTLALAGDAATALRAALLRVLVRSESPALGVTLANLIDETVPTLLDPGRPLTATARKDNALRDRILTRFTRSKDVNESVVALLQGENAWIAETELRNIRAVLAAPAIDQKRLDLRAKAIERSRRLIDEVLRELSLKAGMPRLDAELHQRIDRATALKSRQKPIDFGPAAAEWAERLRRPGMTGATFPARLQAASQVEALRGEGDPTLARDLQFAAHIANEVAASVATARDANRGKAKGVSGDKLFEPLTRFEAGFNILIHDRTRARETANDLSKLGDQDASPESIEELALDASASAWRHQAEETVKADAILTREIARSSQEESRRFQEEMSMLLKQWTTIDQLLAKQIAVRELAMKGDPVKVAAMQLDLAANVESLVRGVERTAATQPAPEIRDMTELSHGPAPSPNAANRNPLAAAAWYARMAAEELAGAEDQKSIGRSQAVTRQQEVITSLKSAGEQVIRAALQRRLEEVPSIAPLFQPYGPDEGTVAVSGGGWPRYGTRFHESFRTNVQIGSPRDTDPAGYQDQLKAYFDAVTKAQQGRR